MTYLQKEDLISHQTLEIKNNNNAELYKHDSRIKITSPYVRPHVVFNTDAAEMII